MNPFAELISMIISVYVNIILLRFFLQYFRADFYNPMSQFVVKVTDPFVKPLRKVVPGLAGLDVSCLVLAWLMSLLSIVLVGLINSGSLNIGLGLLLVLPLFKVISGCFQLFMFLIFVRAISSWFMSGGYNPILAVVTQLTEPLLGRCRKILPATGGFDLSPMIALLGLMFIHRLIEYYVYPVIIQLFS